MWAPPAHPLQLRAIMSMEGKCSRLPLLGGRLARQTAA
jgi:hypothetical protein